MKNTILIATLAFSRFIQAESNSIEKLLPIFESAVAILRIQEQGINTGIGSGFFISENGLLLTNRHVISPTFNGTRAVVIETKDGQRFSQNNIKILTCDLDKHLDLCLLKIDYRPKFWFKLNKQPTAKGRDIYTLGHPRGYLYSMSKGTISGEFIETTNIITGKKEAVERQIKYIQLSAPISPGNSGGPIFDIGKNLLGIATWIRVDQGSQNLNFGISADEMYEFYIRNASLKPISFAAFQTSINNSEKERYRMMRDLVTRPILNNLDRPDPHFKPMVTSFNVTLKNQKDKIQTALPNIFGKDALIRQSDNQIQIASRNDGVFLTITLVAGEVNQLKKTIAQTMGPEKPLPLVKELIASGKWESLKKSLTAKQIKFLHSVTSPLECREEKQSIHPFWNKATSCSVGVFNDGFPGATSLLVASQIQGESSILMAYINNESVNSASYFYDLPYIVIGSAEIIK